METLIRRITEEEYDGEGKMIKRVIKDEYQAMPGVRPPNGIWPWQTWPQKVWYTSGGIQGADSYAGVTTPEYKLMTSITM